MLAHSLMLYYMSCLRSKPWLFNTELVTMYMLYIKLVLFCYIAHPILPDV